MHTAHLDKSWRCGATTRALAHLDKALQAQPDNPQLVVQVASLLADSRDPAVRNPQRAIALGVGGLRRARDRPGIRQ